MPVSEFIAGVGRAQFADRTQVTNTARDPGVLDMGDAGKAGGADDRHHILHSWDLTDPSVGLPLEDGATINSIRYNFIPSNNRAGEGAGNPDYTHEIALMESDGHWDRSTLSPLHQQQGAASYSAPAQSDTVRMDTRVVSDVISSRSSTAVSHLIGFTGLSNRQTIGCTIETPAFHDVTKVEFWLSRPDSASPDDPDMRAVCYSLEQNGRHFALKDVLATSNARPYSDLTLTTPGGAVSIFRFTFPTVIPIPSANEWRAYVIEGDWFSPAFAPNQYRINFNHVRSPAQSSYHAATFGSAIYASQDASAQFENSLSHYYFWQLDVPALYPAFSSTRLTTPYKRYFGNPIQKTECGPWAIGVPKSYGSATSGADEIFPGIETEVQSWMDTNFDVVTGKTWMGTMFGIPNPDNEIFQQNNSGAGMTLVIDWTPGNLPPTIDTSPVEDGQVGVAYFYDVDATDPDGDTLVYSLEGTPPTGMTIDSVSGVILWLPAPGQEGINPVTVRATDPLFAFDEQIFNVTVVGNITTIEAGDLTRRTVAAAGDLTRRTTDAVGDLTRRTVAAAGDLTRRTTDAAGDLTRRVVEDAGDLKAD